MSIDYKKIKTLGALKKNGYKSLTVKEELRRNLICALQKKENAFEGILGFDQTVIPELQRAILARHNIILLGLRGQAKTKIARLLVNLLDEHIPVVAGSEINDDPLNPISRYAIDKINDAKENTPIDWVHRSERYTEKLATPDVSIADLIGDIDPIKAATNKLAYSDERVIHFGLIPRSHRSIFVINELPDLQARIQVALFNILQEKDLQIRGFKVRLPLDVQFVFTANPEDYTNRGSIVTPLKDRIDSQILTHYPKTIKVAREITEQESRLHEEQQKAIEISDILKELIEQIAFEARDSEYVDSNSGVSARLTISALENLTSTTEHRMYANGESKASARISDLYGVIPSITGKVELVYEGEQEGPIKIAHILINKAFRTLFTQYFPDPEKWKQEQNTNPYQPVIKWFNDGNNLELLMDIPEKQYRKNLSMVPGLEKIVKKYQPKAKDSDLYLMMEFILHGLAEFSFLSKYALESGVKFRDMMGSMLNITSDDEDDYRSLQDYL